MKTRTRIVLAAVGLGLLIWVFDATLDYVIFYPGSFWGLLLTQVPPHELYVRLLILACFLAFGLVASVIVERRERAERATRRANRALRMLSESNQALIRAQDEDRLLQDVCNIIVRDGGFALARVAFAKEGEPGTVTTMAQAARDEARLDQRVVDWIDPKRDESPAAVVLRTEEPAIYEDLSAHPPPSRGQKRTRPSAGSLVVLPLTGRGRTIGVLGVHALEPDAFSDYEVRLLHELASDLAYGVLALRDREERRRAEEAVRRSEARYRSLLNSIQAGVVVHDADTKIIMANAKAAELLGLTRDQLLGRTAMHPDWAFLRADGTPMPADEYPASQVRATGAPLRDVTVGIRMPDIDDMRWVSVRADPVFDAAGDLQRIVVTFMDITARKRAEQELRRNKVLLDTAGELAQVGGWEVIPETEQVRWTEQTRRIHAVPADYEPDLDEAIDFFHPDDQKRLAEAIQRALDHGEPYDMEVRLITAAGEQRWTRTLCRPQIADGRTVKLLGAFQDITAQKRSEQALAAERNRAQRYLDIAGVMIVALDATGRVTLINRKGRQILGRAEDELVGEDWFDIAIPERSEDQVRETFRLIMAGKVEQAERAENPIVTRSGEERTIVWHNTLLTDEAGEPAGTLSSGMDVTERRRAEKGLEQYTARLETLREMDQAILTAQSPDETAAAALERVHRLVPCLATSVALFDFDRNEARILAIHAERDLPVEPGTTFPLEGMEEAVDLSRQGEPLVEPDLAALPDPPPAMRVVDALGVRAFVAVPLRVRGDLIGTMGLAAAEPRAFDDEHVTIAGDVADQLAIAIHEARLHAEVKRHADVLERRVAERTAKLRERVAEVQDLNRALKSTLGELRVANQKLDQTARDLETANTELEAFVYSVSHDLRAPLRAIHGFAQIIARRHRDDLNEEGRHYFDNIVEASQQMSDLIQDLLRYSRLGREAVRLSPVSLQQVLSQVRLDLAESMAGMGAELVIPEDLPVVRTNQTLLRQIFINLIDNALTYHRPGVPPHVEVRCETRPDSVVLSVADDGIGIPAEFHNKIFRIFQRLHSQDEYPGTGVGLSIVRKAAQLLGGRVWVESAEGEGSTFYVELPATAEDELRHKGSDVNH